MESRTLYLANHDDPAGDVGRDISTRISHVSALLQQLALRGRFGVSGEASEQSIADSGLHGDSAQGLVCTACGMRPCQCPLPSRGQLKADYLGRAASDQEPGPDESHTGRLVAADDLQRDALRTWIEHERQQWTERLHADLAPSAATAERILADPAADRVATLAAARVLAADTQLAADAARHREAVAQSAERWHDLAGGDKWAQYLPADADLAAESLQQRPQWAADSMSQLVPALELGDTAGAIVGDHAMLDAGVRSVATTWGMEKVGASYRLNGQDLTAVDRTVADSEGAAGNVEADVDDRVADIAAYQQRAAAEDADPATVPTPLRSAAIAKARQGRAANRFVDSDGDLKEVVAHEAVDLRELQRIRSVTDHLVDMPDPTPLPGRGSPTQRT